MQATTSRTEEERRVRPLAQLPACYRVYGLGAFPGGMGAMPPDMAEQVSKEHEYGVRQRAEEKAARRTIQFSWREPPAKGGSGASGQVLDFIPLHWPEALETMQDPNAIVVRSHSLTLKLYYPLSRTFEFTLQTPDGAAGAQGFTRRELAKQILALYARIYREEEETMTSNPNPQFLSLNRPKSNGRYGIWGHDLHDLLMHSAYENPDGSYSLGIDS